MERESAPDSPESPNEDDSRLVLDSIRRIVQLLRRSSNQSERRMGLSAAQLFVLHKLRDVERLSVGELAARTLTSQSSVSEVVQKLVTAGHVARVRSTRDGRSVELSLTQGGRKLIEQAPIAPQDYLLAGLSRMPPRDRRQLARLISRLVKETGVVNIEPRMMFAEDGGVDDGPAADAAPSTLAESQPSPVDGSGQLPA